MSAKTFNKFLLFFLKCQKINSFGKIRQCFSQFIPIYDIPKVVQLFGMYSTFSGVNLCVYEFLNSYVLENAIPGINVLNRCHPLTDSRSTYQLRNTACIINFVIRWKKYLFHFFSYQLFIITYIIIEKKFKTATCCTSHAKRTDKLRIVAKGFNTPAMNEEIACTSTRML